MINVTRSIMPDFEKYIEKIKKLWETRWLTNNGEYLVELEKKLEQRFQTRCIIVSNGTLAMLIALELFDFPAESEVITTPFTFIATSSSIIWQKLKPVFVDIEPDTFNIDPLKIEEKINKRTVAILGVHVFGNPCNIEQIEEIARKNKLRVIYDASHCFDVYYKGESVYSFGDVSTASFHATKVFHTVEGGAIFTNNSEFVERAKRLRNFGFNEKIDIVDKGINAKMNEFQAVMGLLNLEIIDEEIKKREQKYNLYMKYLKGFPKFQKMNPYLTKYNYIYMPVIFDSEFVRDKVFDILKLNGVNTRKYFYPSLNTIFSQEKLPISEEISKKILHLPLYGELEESNIEKICHVIRKVL